MHDNATDIIDIVINVSELPKLVHKQVDTGSGGAHHQRQGLMVGVVDHRLDTAFLSIIRQQKENAR